METRSEGLRSDRGPVAHPGPGEPRCSARWCGTHFRLVEGIAVAFDVTTHPASSPVAGAASSSCTPRIGVGIAELCRKL